jgi:hypothetical protein
LAQDRLLAAAFLLGWGVFVTLIDNFLRPWLVAGRAEVGALTVFVGVLGGVAAFGPIGLIAGPLVLARDRSRARRARNARGGRRSPGRAATLAVRRSTMA